MPSYGMDVVLGQSCCAGHMQPLQPPYNTHIPHIEMDDGSSNQVLTNLFQACLCATGKLAGGGEDDRLKRRIPVERSQQLGDTCQGDELLAVQVAGECLQTQTLLCGLRNARGKLSLYARTTAKTLLHLCLMLGHFDAGRRNVEYLPFLMPLGTLHLQLCLAGRAFRQPMNDDMVRFSQLHQGPSFVPGSPPNAAACQSGADSCACLSSNHRCAAACRCCDCLSPVDPAIAGSTSVLSQSVPAAVGSWPVALPLAPLISLMPFTLLQPTEFWHCLPANR